MSGEKVLLAIDQAEEIFSLNEENLIVFDNFLSKSWYKLPMLRIVMALHADFVEPALGLPKMGEFVQDIIRRVGPFNEADFYDVIFNPATQLGVSFRPPNLPNVIVNEAIASRVDLPTLQVMLARLWEKREDKARISDNSYESMGGLDGALSAHALDAMNDFCLYTKEDGERIARSALLKLVSPAEDAYRDMKRVRFRDDLDADEWRTLEWFATRRLVVIRHSGDKETAELAHESLLRGWKELRRWLDEARAFWVWLNDIERRANIYFTASGEEQSDYLLRDSLLARAEDECVRRKKNEIPHLVQEYVRKSRETRDQVLEAERHAREALQSERDLVLITQSRFLADLARQALEDGDPLKGILLSLEGLPDQSRNIERPWEPEAEFNLYSNLFKKVGVRVLKEHTELVVSVAFSPDGSRLATASSDKTVRIWEAATGVPLTTLKGHAGGVENVAFSPDGLRLATASADKTVRIWDALKGVSLATLSGHTKHILSVVFSSDGLRLATASYDNTARVWDAATGALIATLEGHTNSVQSVAFSPDGLRLATASYDNIACIWNPTTSAIIAPLLGHTNYVLGVAFSPDGPHGSRLATASADKTARLWDASTGAPLAILKGHTGSIYRVAFSPDGSRLATASADAMACVWNADTGALLAILKGHTEPVRSVAFSPDGLRLATASADKTARLWDVATGAAIAVLREHKKPVVSVAFSSDKGRLATASDDHTARIWPIFPTTQALVDYAKQIVTRALTSEERQLTYLPNEPPDWYIDLEKPPYHTQAWKDWLAAKRAGNDLPMPE